ESAPAVAQTATGWASPSTGDTNSNTAPVGATAAILPFAAASGARSRVSPSTPTTVARQPTEEPCDRPPEPRAVRLDRLSAVLPRRHARRGRHLGLPAVDRMDRPHRDRPGRCSRAAPDGADRRGRDRD